LVDRSLAALVTVASITAAPLLSRAQAARGAPARVDYEAPPECPGVMEFNARLAARSAGHESTRADVSALVVRIRSSGHGSQAQGELSVRYADGSEATRVVGGDTCDSVVDALALMSAMSLTAVASPLAPPKELPATPPGVDDVSRDGPLDGRPGLHLSAGAGGGATFAMAPVAAPEALVFLEGSRQNGTLWSPSLRAGFEYAASGATNVPGGAMKVTRSLGELDGCPLAWSPGAFRLSPCVHMEVGALEASGLSVMPENTARRPWFAAGALARTRYVMSSRIFVELTGGVVAPFVRDRFYFEPTESTVFRAPAVSGFVSGGIGVTIR
jgi:hypothetical protein